MFGYVSPVPPRVLAPDGARTSCLVMKAPARMFKLSDWYGDDWDHKKPADELWVSPWAKAHYKLRQQEIEIEQCKFLLQQAIAAEEYFEADGLKERAERLRSMHPITPREEVTCDPARRARVSHWLTLHHSFSLRAATYTRVSTCLPSGWPRPWRMATLLSVSEAARHIPHKVVITTVISVTAVPSVTPLRRAAVLSVSGRRSLCW